MHRAAVVCLGAAGCLCAQTAHPYALPVVLDRTGTVRSARIAIPNLQAAAAYSLLFAVRSPQAFGADSRVALDLRQGGAELVHKTLHLGDPDLYAVFHVPRNGKAELEIAVLSRLAGRATFHLQVNRWPDSPSLEKEPNDRWQQANPIALGGTVFGSADDVPYLPLPGASPAAAMTGDTGVDWFRFEFRESRPKLVFFQVELNDRDNIPADVAVFRIANGQPVAFTEGADPVTPPHEVQALAGNKFTTRILREPGTYYVRVRANHPFYELRTRVYDPPPYPDPQQAVQTAVDYILGAGDSWHANTPRRGGRFDRVASVHQETSLCVACHVTHFSQRAQLYALQNGYELHQRRQLQFLAERFYNNPRPFYGFERQGATWARVISAPANVLSRMAVLMGLFETQVTGARRDAFHQGISDYLQLYYKDREKLPPDETNGNTPLVSTYEVAWYSWRVRRDPNLAALIEQDAVKNVNDLCYQTLALADIDAVKYRDHIRRNAERILALERPDGQWAMRFEPSQPEAEFETGHALWALQAAGVPRDNPQVAKAIHYLLGRQQPFGGWMDPLQSYENFRTPFRETQMAVLGLSAYYPRGTRPPGWHSTVDAVPDDPPQVLASLERAWDVPAAGGLEAVRRAAASNDALIRRQALEALGRFGLRGNAPLAAAELGDDSKLVQRTAAWALRQIYSRRGDTPLAPLEQSLASADARTRWGATRVFAHHFSALARYDQLEGALAALAQDPLPTIRMQALRGLWQFWFWTPNQTVRGPIEDTFLASMAQPQHPWVARALREGVYNLADENIRYLYNNWVPLLADPADRERAIRGRLAVEDRLARKFAAVLESGSDRQRRELLAGLTEFHLRRADVYDLKADHTRPAPPVYNRIGNDTEQIAFFGASAERLSRALLPLLDSTDPEIRRLAVNAALLVRPVRFPGVNEVAGSAGPQRDALLQALRHQAGVPPEVLNGFAPPRKPAVTSAKLSESGANSYKRRQPDEGYFVRYVRPILEKPGRDGYACVQCHATHTRFNGSYVTALNVVDLADSENSLILRKPTSGFDSEGVVNSRILSHGGGVRWDKDSPEYRTILKWIRGAGRE